MSSSRVPDEPTASNKNEQASPESSHPSVAPAAEVPAQPTPSNSPGGTERNGGNGGVGTDDATALLHTPWQTTAPSPADTELTGPLWAIRDVTDPPLVPQPSEGGPAVRESRGAVPTWLMLTLAVIVAVGAVGGGAWFFTATGHDPAGSQDEVAGSYQRDPTLADRLPRLPGRQNPQNATMTVDRGASLGLYRKADARAMKENGADEIIYRNSTDGEKRTNVYTLITIPTPSADNAENLTDQLTHSGLTQGFTTAPLPDHDGIRVLNRTEGPSRLSVVWYVSGRTTVGVGVAQARGDNENELRARLIQTLKSVKAVLPIG